MDMFGSLAIVAVTVISILVAFIWMNPKFLFRFLLRYYKNSILN